MIPNEDMRSRLAFMNARDHDGTLRPRDHLQRAPIYTDLSDKAKVDEIFHSGGAGMFAKPSEYCSMYSLLFLYLHF